jgi:hypothetical protein
MARFTPGDYTARAAVHKPVHGTPDSNVDADQVTPNSCQMPTTPSPSFPIAGSPIVGRHYQTGLAVAAHHRDGCIVSIEPASSDPTRLPWMAPPLTDLQVNGFGGIDFQRLGVAQAALEHACQGLLAAGCGRFLLTLITDEWSRQLDRLRLLAALRERSPLLRIMLAGWHVEGPFLSSEPGFHRSETRARSRLAECCRLGSSALNPGTRTRRRCGSHPCRRSRRLPGQLGSYRCKRAAAR